MALKKRRYGFEYKIDDLSTTFWNAHAHFSQTRTMALPTTAARDFKTAAAQGGLWYSQGFKRLASRTEIQDSPLTLLQVAREVVHAKEERSGYIKTKTLGLIITSSAYLQGVHRLQMVMESLRKTPEGAKESEVLKEAEEWLEAIEDGGVDFLESPIDIYLGNNLKDEAVVDLAKGLTEAVREHRTELTAKAILSYRTKDFV